MAKGEITVRIEDTALAFRHLLLLIAASNRLSAEAGEYYFDDGMGRGALQCYWDEWEQALENAKDALKATGRLDEHRSD